MLFWGRWAGRDSFKLNVLLKALCAAVTLMCVAIGNRGIGKTVVSGERLAAEVYFSG